MPAQAIAPPCAEEPSSGRWTWGHPLAPVAARNCAKHNHTPVLLVGGVACRSCWDLAIVTDLEFALEFGLPIEPTTDPLYVDEIAVEKATRGEPVELTRLERRVVRQRLRAARDHRNRSYTFVCSRASAVRRA